MLTSYVSTNHFVTLTKPGLREHLIVKIASLLILSVVDCHIKDKTDAIFLYIEFMTFVVCMIFI